MEEKIEEKKKKQGKKKLTEKIVVVNVVRKCVKLKYKDFKHLTPSDPGVLLCRGLV